MRELTQAEIETINRVDADWRNPEPADMAVVEALLPRCGKCGGSFDLNISPCQDNECCGIPNSVSCRPCYVEIERFGDLVDLIEQLREQS